ncbi:MAG: pyrroline-5-carboxylate reductase [Gammaproteobacteria bacterium]|nr:pyrroline-5-carboxylate reductase [Gammaproteobacteria bacterium]MBU2676309.1 pyrroline-5-carboxylate reductase [Gammaproteobacteria bacterium]NNC57972.1 pyrroline-5-carboxylate reductase [Woeseiaceae bacterium]NNL50043.1 pyrroline-5-carboxylate reductase [Woeseiaceae bacterium]
MDYGKVAFVGGGNMACALAGGMLAAGYEPGHILISEPQADHRKRLAEELPGAIIHNRNEAVVSEADCVLLAVKPQILSDVCKPLAGTVQRKKPLIISIAAGVRSRDIDAWLGGDLSVVRVMPNQAALLRLGISGIYANERTTPAQLQIASNIIATTGPVIPVPRERDIDTVTAVSGTGPAYFYLLVDMLVKVAEQLGLDHDSALALSLETARGAGELAEQSGETMDTLIARVRSPGGTTAAAFDSLDSQGFRDIFSTAVIAARDRAVELADQAHEKGKD